MNIRPLGASCALLLTGAVLAGPLAAQNGPTIKVGGRVQLHYWSASGDSSASYQNTRVSNGFEIRRLRIQADGRLANGITWVIQPSFEMGALRMRDAYVRIPLASFARLSLGQEKSPFERYELTSSNTLPSIERGLRFHQLTGHEGLNDLLVQNGYGAHDIGGFVDLMAPQNRATLRVGVQNGSRESAADVNNTKSFFGRATATVLRTTDGQPQLQLGASAASRDRAVCSVCTGTITFYADSALRTQAFGADFEVGGFRPGLHLIGDVAWGDNVRLPNRINAGRNTGNVRSTADTSIAQFRGARVVAAWRFNRGESARVTMLEPALRAEWLDPDSKASGDAGVLVTPVLNVYFASAVVLRLGLDWYEYEEGGVHRSAREFRMAWEASF